MMNTRKNEPVFADRVWPKCRQHWRIFGGQATFRQLMKGSGLAFHRQLWDKALAAAPDEHCGQF